ncbi:hypothetical protein [Streptomyces sp. NPDC050759]|uniref:5-methylcytosine restriction system specificity protein McrC n=1 Tax=Streptomyces sp. NPDC050759 TaxID=3365635 RepID=UPI00378988B4
MRLRLDGVGGLRRGAPLAPWAPSRLNSRYVPTLRLAELILREASVEQRGTDTTVSGLLLDLAKVFEDFVAVGRDIVSTGPAPSSPSTRSISIRSRRSPSPGKG